MMKMSKAEKRRREEAILQATVALLTMKSGESLEVLAPGRPVIYMGATDVNRRDPFWYEHPGGRTYKETPEEVIRVVLSHAGTEAVERAVHRRMHTHPRGSR